MGETENSLSILDINCGWHKNKLLSKNKLTREQLREKIINFLLNCKIDKVDIVAGQEFPIRLESNEKLEPNIEGKAEINRSDAFFTGFYIINENYKGGIIDPDEGISKIWEDGYASIVSPRYGNKKKSFRDGYWNEKWISFNGDKIRLINIHISSSYHMKLKLSLLEYLSDLPNKYTVLMGDFNAAKDNDTESKISENNEFIKRMEDRGFIELRDDKNEPQYTHWEKDQGKKLDHVYVSKGLYDKDGYTKSVEYIHNINLTHPDYTNSNDVFTDHSGIKVTFSIK